MSHLHSWLKATLHCEPVYEEEATSALEEYRRAYEDYCSYARDVQTAQMQACHTHSILVSAEANGCHSSVIEAAWSGECDPSAVFLKTNELIDELMVTNSRYRAQLDANARLRRTVEDTAGLVERYKRDTSFGCPDFLDEKIDLLRKKQAEYERFVKENAECKHDVAKVLELVDRIQELDALDNQLSAFHHLPGDIPDALQAIAALEADLEDIDEQARGPENDFI